MAVGIKKRRRITLVIIAFVLVGISTALIGYAFRDGIEFFRAPSQVKADVIDPSETFRIGGLVKQGSIKRAGEVVDFVVTDNEEEVPVRFTGILPDLFTEGQGMIATGTYDGTLFTATEILAKHDETYLPKEVADTLKEQGVYKPNAE